MNRVLDNVRRASPGGRKPSRAEINNGRLAEDNALRRVDPLTERARRASDMVCRFGGEEFAMILPSTPPAEAMLLAERIRADIEAKGICHGGRPNGRENVLTVSIGESAALDHDDLAARSAWITPTSRAQGFGEPSTPEKLVCALPYSLANVCLQD